MNKRWQEVMAVIKTAIGCALFGLSFNLFLLPNGLNSGGISGLSMVIAKVTGLDMVGTISMLINLPLFAIGGIKLGRKFFFGSLLGMVLISVFIDLLAVLPQPELEPLIAALYGGALCGLGLGMVFSTGYTTGGSDIVVRLIKRKKPNIQIGVLNICFDAVIAALTGLAFGDLSRTLYSGVSIFLCGQVVDAVVYRFDYSKVALIITKRHEEVVQGIAKELHRGATLLHGEGAYLHHDTKVILTAVKRHQVAEMKGIVVDIDPEAFIIVQEAHQVLGDGFTKYSKDAL